jgi:glucokinase
MPNNLVVGVDIGGTKVAAGLVDPLGQIRAHTRTPMNATDAALGLAAVSTAIRNLLSQPGSPQEILAIGICAPGPLNPKTGVVINPPNLPAWHNFPLAAELRRIYTAPVTIDNDANAAALAEAKWGAGRGYRNIFYATIGTGIGAGIIFDGKIYHGRTGSAAEGGHIGIDPNGPLCPCGKRGCIEILAAGPAIAKRARKKLTDHPKSLLLEMAGGDPQKVTGEMVGKAYAAGDHIAETVLVETAELLAYWLSNIVDLLEPDVIIIGGGVASMLAPLFEQIRQRWVGACLNPFPLEIPLLLAHYKEDAGIAGAAALCDTMQPQAQSHSQQA